MKATMLGSGSKGNCTIIEHGSTRLMVDCGFGISNLIARLTVAKIPMVFDAILITHEHGDHSASLAKCCKRFNTTGYATPGTTAYLSGPDFQIRAFRSGGAFQIGDILIESIPVSHDALDPVGFIFHGDKSIGLVTDLGCVTPKLEDRLRSAHGLFLESNFDRQMLLDEPTRPWTVKQRVACELGHLQNEVAASLIAKLKEYGTLEQVTLCHLSEAWNTPDKAVAAVARLGLDYPGFSTQRDISIIDFSL